MTLTPAVQWEETEEELNLRVKLRDGCLRRGDVVVSDAMVKINAPPYLLVLDLFEDVCSATAEVSVISGGAVLALPKRRRGLWHRLKASGTKEEIVKRRQASIAAMCKRICAEAERRRAARIKADREDVDRRLGIDQKKRQMLREAKESELRREREDLTRWTERAHHQQDDITEKPPSQASDGGGEVGETQDDRPLRQQQSPDKLASKPKKEAVAAEVPRRTFGHSVEVRLTELETPCLPARERREAEIRAFKRRHDAATVESTPAASTEERHPAFLKSKGDAYYRQGNYRSALNAYSSALEIEGSSYKVRSNRSACYYALEQWTDCVQDCREALTALSDAEDGDAAEIRCLRAKLCCRSGAARARLGDDHGALTDFVAALEFDPKNETALRNRDELQARLCVDDIGLLSRLAVAKASQEDFAAAYRLYSKALDCESVSTLQKLQILYNRSLCSLREANYARVVKDLPENLFAEAASNRLCAKLHALRGNAETKLGRYDDALEDLRKAARLYGHEEMHEEEGIIQEDIKAILSHQSHEKHNSFPHSDDRSTLSPAPWRGSQSAESIVPE